METLTSILLVEDNEDDAVIIERELRRNGLKSHCLRVETEPDFLRELDNDYDIILTDYNLPQFSGMRVLELLRMNNIDVPCIMVSGKYGEDTAVDAMRAGAVDFLVKSNLSRLVPAIQREIREYRLRKKNYVVEAKLVEREEIFHKLVEQSVEGVILAEKSGMIIEWNAAMYHISGMPEHHVAGVDIWDVFAELKVHCDGKMIMRDVLKDKWQKIDTEGLTYWQNVFHAVSIVHTDYGIREIETGIFQVKGVETLLYCMICRDVTERKKNERSLKESEDRYKLLLSSVTDYIFSVKVSDGIAVHTTHSEGCRAVTGYTPEELYQNSLQWYAMIHEDDRNAVNEKTTDILHGISVMPFEHRIYRKDGAVRWVRNTIVLQTDLKGTLIGYDGLISDITERKYAEEELIKRERMLAAIDYASELFLKNPNWLDVIDEIIKHIGIAAQVSRVYIFQNEIINKKIAMNQLFEWTDQGISEQLHNPTLTKVTYADAGAERWLCLGENTIICGKVKEFPVSERILLEDQGIQSIAVVPIYVKNEWWGFIGFDECRYERDWLRSELELLNSLAHLIGTAIEHTLADKVQAEYIAVLSELSETASSFNEAQNIDEIIDVVGALLQRILPEAYTAISYITADNQAVSVRKMLGFSNLLTTLFTVTGMDPGKTVFPLDAMKKEDLDIFTSNKLETIQDGIYMLLARKVPKKVCHSIEKMLRVRSVYAIGFAINGKLLGGVSILLQDESIPDYQKQTIETAMQQAAIAINRIRINEALRESEEKYRRLVELAQEGILYVDASDTIQYANARLAEMLGYMTIDKLIGVNIFSILNNDMKDSYMRITRDNSAMKNYQLEFIFTTAAGIDLFVVLSASPVYSEDNTYTGLVALITDITERKKAEQEEKIRQQQLMQADKMVSLGMLVSGVAHEINNPNNFILLNVPVIDQAWKSVLPLLDDIYEKNGDFIVGKRLKYSQLRDSIQPLIQGVEDGANRIKIIVEELKDFARQDTMDTMTGININTAVNNALKLISPFIKKSTDAFTIDLASDMPIVDGNLQRIEQVIINLVQNACQALTEPHQSVTVRTRYNYEKSVVELVVRDEGCGIPEKDLKFITDPFFTTKGPKKGTGLGLSVSLKIVHDHNGTMDFSSIEGKGTTVTVSFPVNVKEGGRNA